MILKRSVDFSFSYRVFQLFIQNKCNKLFDFVIVLILFLTLQAKQVDLYTCNFFKVDLPSLHCTMHCTMLKPNVKIK